MRRLATIIFAAFALAIPAVVLYAQDEGESLMDTLARAAELNAAEQRNMLVQFVEDTISTPDRQIRLAGIDGVLSAQASIAQITVADTEGIYLVIENAAIDWDQGALLFGRLDIRSLSADSISYIRNPVPPEQTGGGFQAPAPEAGGFTVPELPVAVEIQSLSAPSVRFGEQVFGLGSEISVDGAISLVGGALDANLDIERLDGPGGTLELAVAYANETREIDLSLTLTEPENGIVANLLNIEGRPDIALGLTGAGPIEDLDVALTFDAGGNRVLEGTGVVDQTEVGIAISADLGGPITAVLPEPYRPFFGENTAFSADVLLRTEGGVSVSGISLTGGQLELAGSASTTADGFLNRLDISAEIASRVGRPVILPVPGAATRVERVAFNVDYGIDQSEDWTGTLDITGFSTERFAADTLLIDASGVAANLEDPATRRVTFNADGALSGISASSPEIEEAFGNAIGLGIAALWQAGDPITLAQFRLMGEALTLDLSGEIDDAVFDGTIGVETTSIAPFSGLAGRDLSGAMSLAATGTVSPLVGGFDLTLDGTALGLSIDDPVADNLLAGEIALSGRVARTARGLEAENFALTNAQVEITADGTYATGAADFALNVALSDLALIDEQLSGALTATGTARGSEGRIALDFNASVPQGRIAERTLTNANAGFTGVTQDGTLSGTVSGTAFLDGFRVTLGADIDSTPERLRLADIAFSAPGAELSGNLTRFADGLMDARLTLDAPEVETAAALALVDASGTVNADIILARSGATQNVTAEAQLSGLTAEAVSVGSATADIEIEDLFGVPVIRGTIDGRDIVAAGTDIDTVMLRAVSAEDTTRFDGSAALGNGTELALAGALSPIDAGYSVALDTLSLTQGALSASLAAPATLTVADDTVQFSGIEINAGSGRITATGSAGEALDIDLTVSALPLSIANAVAPGLGLAGTLEGEARIFGAAANPQASFSISGAGLNAAAVSEFGIAPFSVTAEGRYADRTVTLTSASATGAQGLQATASGTIPLAGRGLSVSVRGTAPLSLASRFVADRGAQVSGTATVDAQVTGRLDNPQFSGTVSVANGDYIDPGLALRLVDITGSAQLTGERIAISALTARLATGGSVSATGTIGLDAPAFTSDVTITLDDARYADGYLLVATLNGTLNLSGPIGRGGRLSGRVDIDRADITLPEGLGGSGAVIDVRHVSPPPAVLATLARAQVGRDGDGGAARSSPLALDVTISAPNQVFIRGLGLDAEVGGQLRITGNVADVQPVGGLELIRGRFSILGQRIDFESGRVTLIGDLDPYLDFVASAGADDLTVFITVTGRASSPEIEFSSQPALPQDEVLAQLIFRRSVGELSPLQLAQLAATAAELAGGGGGNSLLDSLRTAAGLDDLDIVTDAEGNASVRAGTYLDDNIYLGVEAGAENRVSINIDITQALTARGSTSASGESEVGVFYETDY
ncbi:translocation/assembly module TamB domain-containing protein [Pelagibacterium xiamenense]|uniref:translocation/assembly module TamB domain-containing protein n=1 Tax=Pelagibacterium xiamenense TaxID=2901140 RepID=UPI001E51AD97|nr:translocation/assembly module TamB domain-containing protein [Pelagibacterium xiamenense]MCD7058608.1 translocation/assembly module TamB domain-containing protein [Pelagibacterium xiamenense]